MTELRKRCPECRILNPATHLACRSCAADLAAVEAVQPPGTARIEGAVAYIVCSPFPPVPLVPGTDRLNIGRTEENDVVLPHHAVSRVHGEVWATRDGIRFVDRSSNGSLVNGSRVDGETTLRAGDVLTVGPYDLQIADSVEPSLLEVDQRTSDIDFSELVTGLLEETSLLETLQSLEFGARTGSLKVDTGRQKGVLTLKEGKPWSASFGDQRDRDAVMAMLALPRGRFMFGPGDVAGPQTLQGTITGLLLDFSRLSDEDRRTMRQPKVEG